MRSTPTIIAALYAGLCLAVASPAFADDGSEIKKHGLSGDSSTGTSSSMRKATTESVPTEKSDETNEEVFRGTPDDKPAANPDEIFSKRKPKKPGRADQ